ncbi:MAG TPA: efflux RND transporter permease subunit [Thermoanaerobaculia bacterium]|nr:efflux RND transporter permease subunit [Thermoanaerobaculia bacterium]
MRFGFAGRVARAFLESKLTPLLILASLALGALALIATPREEEPQIRVPMVDVMVAFPGAEPSEVSSRVAEPIERAMWSLSRVEHVYSTARPGFALVTVRFAVGEPYEPSLVKVYERLSSLGGQLPQGSLPPAVELRTIDDVPFLTLTLWSEHGSSDSLRPLAAELAQELSEIPLTSKAYLIGGQPRAVRVEPDLDRLAATGVTFTTLSGALRSAAARQDAGTMVRDNRETRVEAGPPFAGAGDVARTVVGVRNGRPIYVEDVARVIDGPAETTDAVFYAVGPARADASHPAGSEFPAVTIAVAKRPGANATALAEAVRRKVTDLRPRLLPADVHIEFTRDYGKTAEDKSNELVQHLLLATLSVALLITLTMGWRSGLVVGIAVPVTLALTLFIYFLAGYTLNRVTLFALIFSIGILVDDAIVVVENIERHHRERPREPFWRVAVEAVDEVGNPTILATFTVIAAILPMAFVRGLMGPYMRPIPTGASAAMLFSLAVAFIVSPWAAFRIFRHHQQEKPKSIEKTKREGWSMRLYRRVMTALIQKPLARWAFFAGTVAALLAAAGMVYAGLVKVKMLPFDNKSELQVVIDQDAGTPLEATLATAREMSRALTWVPEVRDVQIYAGTAAPFNFNGLVRHYFLRRSPAGADLQVNFVGKDERKAQSHDLAKRVRPALVEIARRHGARVKVVEIPPGPPVLDTLVAEIYGPTPEARESLARTVQNLFNETAGVVDADGSLEAARDRATLTVDREKAGLAGVPAAAVLDALAGAGAGRDVGALDVPASREPVPITLRLSAADRASLSRRLSLRVDSPGGAVALGELAQVERTPEPQPILHKDLKPVVYVFGDLAGERESPVYALAELNKKLDALRLPSGAKVERYSVEAPETSDRPALKWDGEWQITYEVFRDLGIAFAVVLVLIAILVIGWFQSFKVPFAILLPIPLSLIGILPGHWLFGAFFTATSMIGFIAGAGIIVRNSIILVDFIELKVRQGMPLAEAVVEAGAVRFRPMLLTASAVVVGSLVILFDPIFQGLAISLMMGEVAATFLSRLAVPVVYYLIARRGRAEALREEGLSPALAA